MFNAALQNQVSKTVVITILLALLSSINSIAQKAFDAIIHYNQKWEICDTPISTYYRVGTLIVDDHSYFTGSVKDYYKNGSLQMEGINDKNGVKQGVFTYYYPNGEIERKGSYENDEMKGIWIYNNSEGQRIMEINCKSNKDFVPVFYKTKAGDTLINHGNGKFILDLKEYDHVFWSTSTLKIKYLEGECINGQKEGEWRYYSNISNSNIAYKNNTLIFIETYKKGEFKFGNSFAVSDKGAREHRLRTPITVYVKKDEPILAFEADFAIKDNFEKRDNLSDFVFSGIKPSINSASTSSRNNMKDYVTAIMAALKLTTSYKFDGYPKQNYEKDHWVFFNGYKYLEPNDTVPVSGVADIKFNISKNGTVQDIKVEGNLPKYITDPIKYYLSIYKNLSLDTNQISTQESLTLTIQNEPGYYNDRKAFVAYVYLNKPGFNHSYKTYSVNNSIIKKSSLPVFGDNINDWEYYLAKASYKKINKIDGSKFNHVFFRFTVDEEGTVIDVNIIGFPQPGWDKIFTDLLNNSPKWKPAELDGKKVRYNYVMDYEIKELLTNQSGVTIFTIQETF